MVDHQAHLAALRHFALRSVQDYDLELVLRELGEHARSVLGLDGAGVTLRVVHDDCEIKQISATDSVTLHVEIAQDALHEGPCVDAIYLGSPVAAHYVGAYLDHWPRYAPIAMEAGFHAVAGIPMWAGGRVIGALNAYRKEPTGWAPEELDAAMLFANVATAFIANATAYSDQATLATRLQGALDSRVLIEQAKGVLAERDHITMDEAFETMRRHARNQRLKLRDAAADVLTGGQTFTT